LGIKSPDPAFEDLEDYDDYDGICPKCNSVMYFIDDDGFDGLECVNKNCRHRIFADRGYGRSIFDD